MKKELHCLLLVYTEEHLDSSLKVLNGFLDRLFPRHQHHFLIIDNARPTDYLSKTKTGITIIGGSNLNREFSGWDLGYEYLVNSHPTLSLNSPLILVNDTFHRSYGSEYLNLFLAPAISHAIDTNQLVGYVDGFPEPVSLFGVSLQYWIRSSLILGNLKTMKRLTPFGITASDEDIFSKDLKEYFSVTSTLSANYQKYIKTWLFGEIFNDTNFAESWHSQKTLTPENFDSFKGKTRAILCEHFFSGRAKQYGIPIYDVRKKSNNLLSYLILLRYKLKNLF